MPLLEKEKRTISAALLHIKNKLWLGDINIPIYFLDISSLLSLGAKENEWELKGYYFTTTLFVEHESDPSSTMPFCQYTNKVQYVS